jgi:MoxR-like ATPase
VLYGSPGTGKTTLATHLGELLKKLGYLRTGQLVRVTRDDLAGQYVGPTAPKTTQVLNRRRGPGWPCRHSRMSLSGMVVVLASAPLSGH